jgi:OHCU decarboxylase
MPLSLQSINALDQDGFVAALGNLFEHSPWVAHGTWPRRPFRDAKHLHAELCATMRNAGRERQLDLIRAHPDLAGRLAQQQKLTAESTREQASAGLTTLPPAELARFQAFNDAYRQRFGIPFIICARLQARDTILHAMETRVNNSADEEIEIALDEIEKIARIRLGDLLHPL